MGFEKSILDNLNGAQRIAASHIQGPLLILAGAGSGKTKTLTSRLAYLIGACGVPSENTLTLTFTNKASKEMQERALKLLKTKPLSPLALHFPSFWFAVFKAIHGLFKKSVRFFGAR